MKSKHIFDSNLFPIKGDISRKDACLLHRLASRTSSDTVFEFGAGGSTIFLAATGKKVHCYEDSPPWIERTKSNLERYSAFVEPSNVTFNKVTYSDITTFPRIMNDVKTHLPTFFYIDGLTSFRAKVLDACMFWAPVGSEFLIHDCRRDGDITTVFDACKKYSNTIKEICPNYRGSNMFYIVKGKQYQYENWNTTEKDDNRVHWDKTEETGVERYLLDIAKNNPSPLL